jgi:parvulin-like peptidyl-prolyl isomerase
MLKKKFLVEILIFSLMVSFVFCADKFSNKILAKVGKDPILLSDFQAIANPIIEQYKKMNPKFLENGGEEKLKDNILEQMIDEKVILQEAKKNKISVTKIKLDKALNEVKSRFKTDDEFKNELAKMKMTEDSFRKKIEEQLIIMEMINTSVKDKVKAPTDEDAKKYYNEHPKEMIEPELVRVRHILMKTDGKNDSEVLKKMTDLRNKIVKDKKVEFSDYAKKYSEDKGTADRGGDVGLFAKGQMLKEFEDTAFNLNVGDISNVIKTDAGYHILKCEEKKLEQKKTFDEVKEYIKQYLYQVEMDKSIKNFILDLKKNIKITRN